MKILKENLYKICDDILKDIIEPSCLYCGIKVDFWEADIQMFTLDDDVLEDEIIEKIGTKYNLNESDLLHINSYTSLIQIALFIYLGSERPVYPEIPE